MVRSRLVYFAFLFNFIPVNFEHKLDSIHYTALRIGIGAMKSSPTYALHIEAGDPPLAIRRPFQCDKCILENLSNNQLISKLITFKRSIELTSFKSIKNSYFCYSLFKLLRLKKVIKQFILTSPLLF